MSKYKYFCVCRSRYPCSWKTLLSDLKVFWSLDSSCGRQELRSHQQLRFRQSSSIILCSFLIILLAVFSSFTCCFGFFFLFVSFSCVLSWHPYTILASSSLLQITLWLLQLSPSSPMYLFSFREHFVFYFCI